jgi:hypothetical protein
MRGLGVGTGGENRCVRVEHWDGERRDGEGRRVEVGGQWYTVEGKEYRVRT